MATAQSEQWAYDHYGDPDSPGWQDANIVAIQFLGRPMHVHRKARNHFLHLERIFRQEAPKYARKVNEGVYDDWSYNNRNIAGTDSKSKHAFGIALDINATTNYRGIRGDMPGAVAHRADDEGFAWGGSWSNPDAMHFETTLTPMQIKRRFDDEGYRKGTRAAKGTKRTTSSTSRRSQSDSKRAKGNGRRKGAGRKTTRSRSTRARRNVSR